MENKRFKVNKNPNTNQSKNSNEGLNTDVDDYTTDELLNLFKLESNPSLFQITTLSNSAITRLKMNEDYDKNILYFLENARDKLLTIFSNGHFLNVGDVNADQRNSNQIKTRNNDLKYEDVNKDESKNIYKGKGIIGKEKESDFNEWYTNEYLPPRDPILASKLTNRIQQTESWNANESHYPMKQNLLGINQSIQIPVSQDTLNPTLRNLNTRIVNLDSQFRQNILPFYPHDPDSLTSSTHYTCELSDTLTKVLSILLYSVQIPNTWYRFNQEQGNTYFKLDYNSITYYFNLPSGNYDPSSIVIALNTDSNWSPSPRPNGLNWDFNPTTSKLSFTTGNLSDTVFYFYDESTVSGSGSGCLSESGMENMEINKNLGWYLGFRPVMYTNSDKQFLTFIKAYSANSTNVVDATIDLTGPKYFSIILDDFNKNRQNKGLVNIALVENTKLNLPNYYSSDLKFDCCGNKVEVSSGKYKKITQAQSYSINQILQNRKNKLQKSGRLISSDILAILPIDINSNTRTQPYTVFGVNMLLNERRYYGPVNINKFKIRLVDDRGLTVNLNGADWTMSLLVNELYQY